MSGLTHYGKKSFPKLSFLHALFLQNGAQIDQNNYGMMLFMSKQVSLPRISSILKQLKSAQKAMYALFAQNPSIENKKLCIGLSLANFREEGGLATFKVCCYFSDLLPATIVDISFVGLLLLEFYCAVMIALGNCFAIQSHCE